MPDPEDILIVPCEACGSEGRLYHQYAGHADFDWSEPCPYCEGTGGELILAESVTEEEIMEPMLCQ